MEQICPRTNQVCNFGDYCEIRKQNNRRDTFPLAIRRAVNRIDDRRVADAPTPLQEAQASSFCSHERIEAVAAAAKFIISSEVSAEEKVQAQDSAILIAKRIIAEREYHM